MVKTNTRIIIVSLSRSGDIKSNQIERIETTSSSAPRARPLSLECRIRTTDSVARATVSFVLSFWKENRDGPSDRGFWSKSKSRACARSNQNQRQWHPSVSSHLNPPHRDESRPVHESPAPIPRPPPRSGESIRGMKSFGYGYASPSSSSRIRSKCPPTTHAPRKSIGDRFGSLVACP